MAEHVHVVNSIDKNQRIDKLVATIFPDWSRSKVQDWIGAGHILINGVQTKSNYLVNVGDQIVIIPPNIEITEGLAEDIPIDIRYEDDSVLVVNKPRGMVVHPAAGNRRGTLVNALLFYCGDNLSGIGEEYSDEDKDSTTQGLLFRPGIVHRIDKDTSGLLMVAKNDVVHQALADQLREHSVDRVYIAVVHGIISHNTGTVDAPIGRDPRSRQRMAVTSRGGKNAVTKFRVLERFKNATKIECRLETGRTHQIRVHMRYIGFPIIGDNVYAAGRESWNMSGQALHAQEIGFIHPISKEKISITSELPEDMVQLLTTLSAE